MAKYLLTILLALNIVSTALSQSGLSFLKIGIGGRASGMGEAFSAVVDDATATYWNPAGLMQLNQQQLFLIHNEWLEDVRSEFVTFALPTKNYSIGFSLNSINIGDIELRGRQPSVDPIATFTAHDLALGLSYARSITTEWDVGVTIKYLFEKIYIEESSGIAGDIGVQYHPAVIPIKFGMTLQNLGRMNKLGSESPELPRIFRLGLAFNPTILQVDHLLFAGDFVHDFEGNSHFHVGTEYLLKDYLEVRLGYQTGYEIKSIQFGFGFRFDKILMDYGYVPLQKNFGQGHRFSFGINF